MNITRAKDHLEHLGATVTSFFTDWKIGRLTYVTPSGIKKYLQTDAISPTEESWMFDGDYVTVYIDGQEAYSFGLDTRPE